MNRCLWCGKSYKNPLKYEKKSLKDVWVDCCTRCANKTARLQGHWFANALGLEVREKLLDK